MFNEAIISASIVGNAENNAVVLCNHFDSQTLFMRAQDDHLEDVNDRLTLRRHLCGAKEKKIHY